MTDTRSPVHGPTPLDTLRTALATDEMLEAQITPLYDPARFAAAAAQAMREYGVSLEAAEVQQALQPDPLGLERFEALPISGTDWPGRQWLPTAITAAPTAAGSVPAVEWKHFGGLPLTDPFYQETARRARALPINQLLRHRTPLSALPSGADRGQAAPDGLIFHMSRCGSTLLAQMIAALPGALVVSEAAPLDSVVQLDHTHPAMSLDERVALLRAMAGALGRDRGAGHRPFVLKLDSWHTLALPLFRYAFPETPWVFLYRDPVEVLVSHMRLRGPQTVPGMMHDLYGIRDGAAMAPEVYIAHILTRICAAVVEHHHLGGGSLVDYAKLPEAVETHILPHFGIDPDSAGRAALMTAAQRNAKAPGQDFIPDAARKRRDASQAVLAAAAIVAPVHCRLVELSA